MLEDCFWKCYGIFCLNHCRANEIWTVVKELNEVDMNHSNEHPTEDL